MEKDFLGLVVWAWSSLWGKVMSTGRPHSHGSGSLFVSWQIWAGQKKEDARTQSMFVFIPGPLQPMGWCHSKLKGAFTPSTNPRSTLSKMHPNMCLTNVLGTSQTAEGDNWPSHPQNILKCKIALGWILGGDLRWHRRVLVMCPPLFITHEWTDSYSP